MSSDSGSSASRESKNQRALWGSVVALGLCLGVPRNAMAQSFCRYEITAVIEGPSCGILGPALVDLLSINDLGQACGYYRHCATFDKRPFAWSEETGLVILPLPEGATSGEAVDINNVLGNDGLGQVVCTLDFPELAGQRACLYDDGAWTILPPAPGGVHSTAAAINSETQIAGHRSTPSATAFRWEDGVFVDIPSTIGSASAGADLNEAGIVVGWMGSSALEHAWYWDGQIIVNLGTVFDGDTARATSINSSRAIVGRASVPAQRGQTVDPRHPFLWQEGHVTDLGVPDDFYHARANATNDAEQILVLASTQPTSSNVIYLWQHGEMVPVVDLVEPLDGVIFGGSSPHAINNRGQIGAVVAVIEGATNAGAILTPIDRPLGDVNFDCTVDEHDLTAVLRDWGSCPAVGSCICDIVTSETFQPPGDGKVDGADLAVVLGNWTDRVGAPASKRRR